MTIEELRAECAGRQHIYLTVRRRRAPLPEYMRLAGTRGPLGRFCTAKPDGKSHVLAVGVWDAAAILKWLDKMEKKQWKS